jgi:peptide subunit release factor 1 (eRF1)
VVSSGGHTHLVLAGNPRITTEIRKALSPHLSAKLIDVIPASSRDKVTDVVEATLSSFIDREEQESLATVDLLESEIRRGGLAVVGTSECLRDLQEGRVDVLVMASSYDPPPGWSCSACETAGSQPARPATCPECGASVIHDVDLKEAMVRLAERSASHIETVRDSETLIGFGGVGCLLRYAAEPPVKEVPHEATWTSRQTERRQGIRHATTIN